MRRYAPILITCAIAVTACSASPTASVAGPDGGTPSIASQAPTTLVPAGAPSASAGPRTTQAPAGRTGTGSQPGVGLGGQDQEASGGTLGGSPDTRTGRGVTATTIQLGFNYSADQSVASTTFGGSGDGFSQKAIVEALIAYFNAHGGIAGRRIVPTWYNIQYTNGSTGAIREQEQCATFTEDHKLFAAGPWPIPSETIATCMKSSGTLMVAPPQEAGAVGFDNQAFSKYGDTLWAPEALPQDTLIREMIDQLAARKWFKPGGKIGFIAYDDAIAQRVAKSAVASQLKKHGLTLTDLDYIKRVYDVNDVAQSTSDSQRLALKFRQEGITEVLGGYSTYLFAEQAKKQGYHPSYGLFTGGEQQIGLDQQDMTTEFHDALYVSYLPFVDVVSPFPGPGAKSCIQMTGLKGLKQSDYPALYGACSYLLFLKTVMAKATTFSPAGFSAAARSLGTSFTPVHTWGTDAFRHATADHVAVGHLKATCDFKTQWCWEYISKPIRITN